MAPSFTPEEIEQFRRDTPGTAHFLHFNSAGSSLSPRTVTDTVTAYLNRETLRGGYRMDREYAEELNGFYPDVAAFIGAKKEEIAFAVSATAAWRLVFNGIPFEQGDNLITSEAEYGANYIAFVELKNRLGVEIRILGRENKGIVTPEELESAIDRRTRLLAINHIPSSSGLIQPAAELGQVARKHGILYLLDACQSIGQIPVNVEEIACDFLAATGRKYLRGPRGTGFLYVKKDSLDRIRPVFLDNVGASMVAPDEYELRADARRFENYETNRALVLGLREAVNYAGKAGIERIGARVQHLGHLLREELRKRSDVEVYEEPDHCGGIVTFNLKGRNPREIGQKLAEEQVNISVSDYNGSWVYMKRRNLEQLLRASLHYFNSEEEIERFLHLLSEV